MKQKFTFLYVFEEQTQFKTADIETKLPVTSPKKLYLNL